MAINLLLRSCLLALSAPALVPAQPVCLPVAGSERQTAPATAPSAAAGVLPDPGVAGSGAAATTLPVVEALRPDPEPLDPFAPRPNSMARRFRHDPSPEEIALRHNGYLMYYGAIGLAKGGRWLNKATGGRDPVQYAAARELPLDEEQIARAARWDIAEP